MSWLGRLFRRDKLERELDKELQFHIDARAEELLRGGLSAAESRRRALAEFGGVEPIKEQARDARGTRWVGDIGQDIRYALRMLRAHKGFTLAAVLSLTIGIGANAAVFRVIDGLILRELPVVRPGELVLLLNTDTPVAGHISLLSHPAYLKLAGAAPTVPLAAYTAPTTGQVRLSDAAELKLFELVSGNWFSTLGVGSAAGRVIEAADDVQSSPRPVVVISDRFWLQKYGRAESAVGSTLRLNNVACTVIGVAREGFDGIHVGQRVDVWAPIAMQHELRYRSNSSSNNADDEQPWGPQDGIAWLSIISRAPESARASALTKLNGQYGLILTDRSREIENETRRAQMLAEKISFLEVSRGVSNLRGTLGPALQVLMGMVVLVLLVACANLANLLLARGSARSREFALRLSLGARRGRLIRQLLTESLTLAFIGGAAGIMVSIWAAPALLRMVSTSSAAPPVSMPLDWRILLFGFSASVVTGVLFGLIPALRLSSPSLQDSLKSGGRVVNAGGRRGRPQLAKALVSLQVAVSMLLVIAAALFVQTFQNYARVDLGLERNTVLTARFDTRLAGLTPPQLPGVYARLLEEARRLPGVTSATLGVVGPVTGSNRMSSVSIEGYEPGPDEAVVVTQEYVGPAYFTTLGQRLVAGRDFDERDTASSRKVVVINEKVAAKYFGAKSPIGRSVGDGEDDETFYEIVGVVSDVRSTGLKSVVPFLVYYPITQSPNEYARNLYIRSAGAVGTLAADLKNAVGRAEPGLAVREVVTLDELAGRTIYAERLVSTLAMVFGLLGIAVACLGLYGTIAYSVARRVNEIGVRLALGASPGGVRLMIVRETMLLAAIGAVAGLLCALPLGKYLAAQLFGLSPRDPMTLAVATAFVLSVGLLAGLVPAWRASRVNPTSALRAD